MNILLKHLFRVHFVNIEIKNWRKTLLFGAGLQKNQVHQDHFSSIYVKCVLIYKIIFYEKCHFKILGEKNI